MDREVLHRAAQLDERGEAYVLATVVWSRRPSSGKQGGMALIEVDGTVTGWIGGACAEPTVLAQAAKVIECGEGRLLRLGPPDELGGDRPGTVQVPISCASEGALEIFLDPVLPDPAVIVIGGSPAVRTLVELLGVMGWPVTVVDDGGDPAAYPAAQEVVTSLSELAGVSAPRGCAVVVATQGHYDEPALEFALATEASYIGLVASRRRSEAIVGYLADRGRSEAELSRIDTPAGFDLGPVRHREIAVAVLAELVMRRARGDLGGAPVAVATPEVAVDPICGMEVQVEGARFIAEVEGTTWYFCCPACRKRFLDERVGGAVG